MVDNLQEITLDLNFKLPEPSPNVAWQSPRNNGNFYRSNFPLTISMDFINMKDVSVATLKYEGGVSNTIGEINTTNGNHVLKWAIAPVAGSYNLFVEFTKNGGKITSDKVTINVQE